MAVWKDIIGVVDIETTDFLARGGKIVEVGVAGLHLPTGTILELFHSICREPGLSQKDRNAWIFSNSSLKVEEVREAPLLEDLKPEIEKILRRTAANTAFNKAFDFPFLRSRGFDIGKEAACPMLLATDVCKLPHKGRRKGFKWPTVEEAWAHFFPEENYVEEHRGLDDAMHEAKIVYKLYQDKIFERPL